MGMAVNLGQVIPTVAAVRYEHQRLAEQCEAVTQNIHAIGHAYHFPTLSHGVCRKGKLIAGDIQRHIDTIRTVAQQNSAARPV